MFDWKRIINRGYDAKPHDEWPVWPHGEALDRTKYVTASEVARCARRTKFDKITMKEQGYDHMLGTKNSSHIDWGFFERGHTIESWLVSMIHAGWDDDEYDLVFTGKEQLSFVDTYQSGTPDGVFISKTNPECGILEIKSIDPRTNKTRLPKPDHVKQVMQNMDLVATNMDLLPIGGELLYIDASDFKDIRSFTIEWDESVADDLMERSRWIMEADSPADLPDEGMYQAGVCQKCPHKRACGEIIAKETNGENYHDDLRETAKRFF